MSQYFKFSYKISAHLKLGAQSVGDERRGGTAPAQDQTAKRRTGPRSFDVKGFPSKHATL